MIVGIEGEIVKKEPTVLYIKTHGLVYEVNVSFNCSAKVNKEGVFLFTTHIIREDGQKLFGFIDESEKLMFDTLIKINGVGPKVALAICSTFTPSEFSEAVYKKDVNMLKRVPGVGPKSASRILVELSEFIVESADSKGKSFQEAGLALESLGFKKETIAQVLSKIESGSTSEIVKEALKQLQRI